MPFLTSPKTGLGLRIVQMLFGAASYSLLIYVEVSPPSEVVFPNPLLFALIPFAFTLAYFIHGIVAFFKSASMHLRAFAIAHLVIEILTTMTWIVAVGIMCVPPATNFVPTDDPNSVPAFHNRPPWAEWDTSIFFLFVVIFAYIGSIVVDTIHLRNLRRMPTAKAIRLDSV